MRHQFLQHGSGTFRHITLDKSDGGIQQDDAEDGNADFQGVKVAAAEDISDEGDAGGD